MKKLILSILISISAISTSREGIQNHFSHSERFLIVTADDYGASQNINEGIQLAAENEIITTISALTNFKESISSLKSLSEKYPGIGIGVHLNITTGKPISNTELVPSLVNKTGNFYTISELLPRIKEISLRELRIELEAQIKILVEHGIRIDHLSNQHGILSAYSPFFKVLRDLAKEYNLPVRSNVLASMKYPEVFSHSGMQTEGYKIFRIFALTHPLKAIAYSTDFNVRDFNSTVLKLDYAQITHPDILIDCFYGDPTETNLNYILENLPPGINEIVLHLGTHFRQQDYPSGLNLGYFSNREQELNTLNNCHFNNHLHQLAIRKISYSEIDRFEKLHASKKTD